MINIPAGARVLVATRPVDARKAACSAAALAAEQLGEDPFSGVVIVFQRGGVLSMPRRAGRRPASLPAD